MSTELKDKGEFCALRMLQTVKLYERCLIACANYPEYWIRYVQRMEVEGNLDLANNALTRATTVFVKRRPEVHLFAARFREQEGDVKGARSAYEVLSSELAPGLLGATVKHANFEHRQGNIEAACSAYEAALQLEKAKEESRAFPILSIQYARFLDQVVGNTEKAQEIYTAALEYLPTSKVLWEVTSIALLASSTLTLHLLCFYCKCGLVSLSFQLICVDLPVDHPQMWRPLQGGVDFKHSMT
jgi:tetratricopeptide (TPR) repeat protein